MKLRERECRFLLCTHIPFLYKRNKSIHVSIIIMQHSKKNKTLYYFLDLKREKKR